MTSVFGEAVLPYYLVLCSSKYLQVDTFLQYVGATVLSPTYRVRVALLACLLLIIERTQYHVVEISHTKYTVFLLHFTDRVDDWIQTALAPKYKLKSRSAGQSLII